MIERRAFLSLAAALAAAGPVFAAPQAGGRLAFAVMRKGRKIGEHVVEFSGDAGAPVARARAEMTVGLGPVTVFRYRHTQVERWEGDRFDSLDTGTVQNGRTFRVFAQRSEDGVRVEGAKGVRPLFPADAAPLTHWNRRSLSGPLFNPQDGKLMRLSIAGQQASTVLLADGREVKATRVTLAGEQSIDDWYDDAGAWTGLRAKAVDGSIVEYRKL